MSARKVICTSQPQTPVGIDWSVAKNVRTLLGFLGNTFYDFIAGRPADGNTLYSTPLKPVATPSGIGIGEPVDAAGTATYGGLGMGYFPVIYWVTFFVKDGSITNANGMLLCSSHKGAGIVGYGNENTCLYWKNTAGERKVGAILSFPAQTIEFSGVSNGLHTVALSMSRNNVPVLFLDGIPVASGTVLSGNYYLSAFLAPTGFEPKTFFSSGVGVVLHKGLWSTGIENSPQDDNFARRITENPWQIFQKQNLLPFCEIHEPPADLDQVISCDAATSEALGETASIIASVKGTYIPRGATKSKQSQQASINWNHPLVKAANICYVVSSHEGGSAKIYWKEGSVETGMPTAKFGAEGRRTSAGSAETLGAVGAGKFLSSSRSIFALFEHGNVGADKLVVRHAAGTGFYAGSSSGVSFSVRTNAGTYFTPRIVAPYGPVKAWGVWNYEANLGSLFIDGFSPVTIATTLNWSFSPDSIDVGGQDGQGLVLAFVCTGVVPAEVRRALADNPWQIFTEQPVPSFLTLEINYDTVVSCDAASAAAVGQSARLGVTIKTVEGSAAAAGTSAQADRTLQTSAAQASAAGPTAIISKTTVVFCTVAPSAAAGVTCSLSGGVSISCTSAQAAASAPSSQIDLSINGSVSQASAVGVTARASKSLILGVAQATAWGTTARRNTNLACGVGAATAQGVTCGTNGAATITCAVGNSVAAAPSAQVDRSLLAGVGSGAALGIGTLLNKSTLTLSAPASALGTTAYADISVFAVAAPASAVGITIPVSGAVTITTIAASASAEGVTDQINTGTTCSIGNAGAVGVTAVLQTGVVISASVAAAIAAGITSQIDKAINAVANSASATGVTASIVVPGNETIECLRALAAAKGVTATVSFTIIITFDVENIQLVSDLCLASNSLSPISKVVVFQSKLVN